MVSTPVGRPRCIAAVHTTARSVEIHTVSRQFWDHFYNRATLITHTPMAEPVDDDEKEQMIRLYADLGSIEKVADHEDIQRSPETVRKYVNEAKEANDPRVTPAEEVDTDDDDQPAIRSPAEEAAEELDAWLESICEKTSLKYDTMRFLLVDDVKEAGDLPTSSQLMGLILNGTTGVSNSTVAEKIGNRYDRWVQGNDVIQTCMRKGEVSMGTMQWSTASQVGMGHAAGSPATGGVGGQMGAQPAQAGVGGAAGQQPAPQQQAPRDDLDAVLDQLEQLEQKRERLSRALGADGASEEVRQLNERIQQLEAALAGEGGGGAGGGEVRYEDFPSSAPPAVQVAWLVNRTEMTTDDAREWVQDNESPEVREVEFEREKWRDRQELYETAVTEVTDAIRDVFGDIGEDAGDAIFDNFMDGGDGDDVDATADQRATHRADGGSTAATEQVDAAAQEVEMGECDRCDGPARLSDDGWQCTNPNCQKGEGPCDLCGEQVTLPAVGEAGYGLCPGEGCTNFLSVGDSDDGTLSCDECDWSGSAVQVRLPAIECPGCGELRPIARTPEQQQTVRRLGI